MATKAPLGPCNWCISVKTLRSFFNTLSVYNCTQAPGFRSLAGLHLQRKAFCLSARAGLPVRDIYPSHVNGTPVWSSGSDRNAAHKAVIFNPVERSALLKRRVSLSSDIALNGHLDRYRVTLQPKRICTALTEAHSSHYGSRVP